MLGVDLLYNFNLPYFSRSPGEFWQRWHISLSSWLRDYLYIPLGGNRRGPARTSLNLMTTMVLGGLWHGAAWNYVLWGFYQGVVLCVYRVLAPDRPGSIPPTHPGPVPEQEWRRRPFRFFASLGLFFLLTCYGWLLFRARPCPRWCSSPRSLFADFGDFTTVIKWPTFAGQAGLIVLIAFEILEYIAGSRTFYRAWPRPIRGAFYAIVTFVLVMGTSNETAQFIYFQF